MNRGTQVAFLIVSLASICANVALYRAARGFYAREARFRLHPTGSPSFESRGNARLPTALLLGDSRIVHWTRPTTSEFRTVNAGVGNETTAQVTLRAKQALDQIKPQLVVIQVGINDLKTIPLFPEKAQEIVDSCVNNILKMADMAEASGARVLITSILPAGEPELVRRLVWSSEVNASVKAANARLRTRRLTSFVDLADLATQVDYVDTLHFNDGFYQKIDCIVWPTAHNALESRTER